MGNNPFMPPSFVNQPSKGGWNTLTGPWEDGPGNHVNPSNIGPVVRYNGQDQTAAIANANPKPPTLRLPGAAPSSMSKIP